MDIEDIKFKVTFDGYVCVFVFLGVCDLVRGFKRNSNVFS